MREGTEERIVEFLTKSGEPKENPLSNAVTPDGAPATGGPKLYDVDAENEKDGVHIPSEDELEYPQGVKAAPSEPAAKPEEPAPAAKADEGEPEADADAKKTEPAPAEATKPATVEEYDLPEDATFVVKADGKEQKVSGKAIADAWRRHADLDKRFKEAEALKNDAEKRAGQLAAQYLFSAGYIDEQGRPRMVHPSYQQGQGTGQPPAAAPTGQPQPGAPAGASSGFRLPTIDYKAIAAEERWLPDAFFETWNKQNEALSQYLETLNGRIEKLSAAPAERQEEPTEAQVEAWKSGVKARLGQSEVFTGNDARLDAGLDAVISLYKDRGFQGPLDEAVKVVLAEKSREYGTTSGAPAPQKRRMPPVAGTTGQRAPGIGQQKEAPLPRFGSHNATDAIKEALRRRSSV